MPGGSVWRLSGVWSARRVDTTMSSRRSCGGFEAPIGAIKKNKTAITKVSFIGVSYIQYPRSPGTLQSKSSAEVDLEKYIRRKIVSTPNFHGRKTITWGPISCPFCISCSLVPFPLSKNSFDFFHPLIGSAARPKAKIDLVESFEQSQCC